MYPPVPFGLPRLVPDGGAQVDGDFVLGGVSVALPLKLAILMTLKTVVSTHFFAASMASANFQHPMSFDPERWLRKDTQDVLDASQPFSIGTRACLGRT